MTIPSVIVFSLIEPSKQRKNVIEDEEEDEENHSEDENIDIDFNVEDHTDEIEEGTFQKVHSSRKRKNRFIDDEVEHSSDDESEEDENVSDVDDIGKKIIIISIYKGINIYGTILYKNMENVKYEYKFPKHYSHMVCSHRKHTRPCQ